MKKWVVFVVLSIGILCGTMLISGVELVNAQPDSAEQENGYTNVVLLNGTVNGSGLAIATGERWNLYQGYTLHVLGIDLVQSRAMIRLLHNNDVVYESWIRTGDHLIYAKPRSLEGERSVNYSVDVSSMNNANNNNSNSSSNVTILSATIDSLYGGGTRDLVMLYPIYQYLDTDYETPVIDVSPSPHEAESNKTPLNNNNNNNSKESSASGISIVIPIMLIVALYTQIKNRKGT